MSQLEVEEIKVKEHTGKVIENKRDPVLHLEIHGEMNQDGVITQVGTENYTAMQKSTERTNNKQQDAMVLSKNLNDSEIAEGAGKTESKALYISKQQQRYRWQDEHEAKKGQVEMPYLLS